MTSSISLPTLALTLPTIYHLAGRGRTQNLCFYKSPCDFNVQPKLKTTDFQQSFSDFHITWNLSQMQPVVCKIWGRAQDYAFLMSSQAVPRLLVCQLLTSSCTDQQFGCPGTCQESTCSAQGSDTREYHHLLNQKPGAWLSPLEFQKILWVTLRPTEVRGPDCGSKCLGMVSLALNCDLRCVSIIISCR